MQQFFLLFYIFIGNAISIHTTTVLCALNLFYVIFQKINSDFSFSFCVSCFKLWQLETGGNKLNDLATEEIYWFFSWNLEQFEVFFFKLLFEFGWIYFHFSADSFSLDNKWTSKSPENWNNSIEWIICYCILLNIIKQDWLGTEKLCETYPYCPPPKNILTTISFK